MSDKPLTDSMILDDGQMRMRPQIDGVPVMFVSRKMLSVDEARELMSKPLTDRILELPDEWPDTTGWARTSIDRLLGREVDPQEALIRMAEDLCNRVKDGRELVAEGRCDQAHADYMVDCQIVRLRQAVARLRSAIQEGEKL